MRHEKRGPAEKRDHLEARELAEENPKSRLRERQGSQTKVSRKLDI